MTSLSPVSSRAVSPARHPDVLLLYADEEAFSSRRLATALAGAALTVEEAVCDDVIARLMGSRARLIVTDWPLDSKDASQLLRFLHLTRFRRVLIRRLPRTAINIERAVDEVLDCIGGPLPFKRA